MKDPKNLEKLKKANKELADRGGTNFQKNNPLKNKEFANEHNRKTGITRSNKIKKLKEIADIGPKIPGTVKKFRTILNKIKLVLKNLDIPLREWDNHVYRLYKENVISDPITSKSIDKYFGESFYED